MAKPASTTVPTDEISEFAQGVQTLVAELPVKASADPVRRFKITTDQEADAATAWLIRVRKRRKDVEAFFNRLVKPFRDAITNHNLQRDNMLRQLREYEGDLDREIKAHRARQAEKAAAEQRKLDTQYEKRVERAIDQGKDVALVKPPPVVAAPAKTLQTEEGTVTFRQIPKFKVIDERLIPAEFWSIDLVKLGKEIRAGRRDIPGVHIWMEETSAVG